jgi:hypothetical protein
MRVLPRPPTVGRPAWIQRRSALTTLITLTRAREVFLNYACQPTTGRHWPRLDQLTLMAPASLPLRLCNIVRVYELRGHPATGSPSAETRHAAFT